MNYVLVTVAPNLLNRRIRLMAASPATTGFSYSGSAQPFIDFASAHENGFEVIVDRLTNVRVPYPNSYYDGEKRLVPPTIIAQVVDKNVVLRSHAFALKSLPGTELRTHFPRSVSSEFYLERVEAIPQTESAYNRNVLLQNHFRIHQQ